jgi:hypothetical protein
MTNYMEYASLFEAGGMLALAVIILVAFRHLRGLRENCPSSEYLRHGGVFRNGGSGSSGVQFKQQI